MSAPAAPSVAAVEAALRTRTGLVLEGPRRAALDSSLRDVLNGTDPHAWAETFQSDSALFDRVIAAITVGETYFFRNPEHFAYLRDEFLPDFHARKPGAVLRAWSAGCSTGEEAYSLAILFDDRRTRADVLATDINRASLAKAKKGLYGRWSLRGDAARLAGAALHPAARRDTFAVHPRLKERVRFAYFNLAEDGLSAPLPAGGMDVIFCRNVLIYLEPAAIQHVARRLFDALADGGVLLTGPSDPLLADAAPFACDFTPAGVRYTKGTGTRAIQPIAPDPLPFAPLPFAPPTVEAVPYPEPVLPAPAAPVDARAALTALQAQANGDPAAAAEAAGAAVKRHPASREILYLHAILLMNLDRFAAAEAAFKRLIYLDPASPVAHFALGNLCLRAGDLAGARRAFTAAAQAAEALPADDVPALSERDTAGQIAAAARRAGGTSALRPGR